MIACLGKKVCALLWLKCREFCVSFCLHPIFRYYTLYGQLTKPGVISFVFYKTTTGNRLRALCGYRFRTGAALFRYWILKKRYYLIQTNLSAYVLSV
jgi:hypothetical protein